MHAHRQLTPGANRTRQILTGLVIAAVVMISPWALAAGPAVDNGTGASSVQTTSAVLNGTLTSTGGLSTQLRVYWGDTDAGTTAASWGHSVLLGTKAVGPWSQAVAGLVANKTYYYRFQATNLDGEAWANPTTNFKTAASAGPAPIDLKSCANFAVLAATTVTSTGPGIINGDVGLSPAGAMLIPPAQINGTIYNGGPIAAQAQVDLTAAIIAASPAVLPGGIDVGDGELGGRTLAPGVYQSAPGSYGITLVDLTLNGGPDDVWVFQMASTLTVGTGRQVILTGGALAKNIFWQVGSSATLQTSCVFKGTILAYASVTMDTSCTMDGRALASTGAVTFNGNGGSVPSVNGAPVAADDTYMMPGDTTLNVPAPSVLGNDSDPNGDTLSEVLVLNVTNGVLTLNPDHSFSYTPTVGWTGTDSFTYKANDGTTDSSTVTVSVRVSAAPVLASVEFAALAYPTNGPATAVSSTITATDADDINLESATVAITGNYAPGQDVLAFTNTATITGVWSAVTGLLALSGTDTVANYQAALRSVTYQNTNANPSLLPRTVTFQVNDGTVDSNAPTRGITVGTANVAPVLAAVEVAALAYPTNGPATAISSTITATDADDVNLESASVAITGNYANGQDVLSFTNTATIAGTWTAATGTLALSGTDTVANYQAALRAAKYRNTSGSPSLLARTVTFKVNDGDVDSNTQTRGITVTAANVAPVLAAIEAAALAYPENGPATAISSTITAADSDDVNLESASVVVTGNYANGQDVLSFTNTASITGTWTAATGTLALTGSDTVANYQAALRAVKYHNSSDNPSTLARTITFKANDGEADSNTQTRGITVAAANDAPVLAAVEVGALAYTENAAATAISSTITAADAESTNLAGATAQITGNYATGQDVLSFTNTASITGTWTALTGTLALSGSDTVANYQAALRAVRYQNTSDNPSTLARTVTFKANDGTADSNTQTRGITVAAVNDAPAAVADAYVTDEDIPLTVAAPGVLGNDTDAEGSALSAALVADVAHGTLVLNADGSFSYDPDLNWNGTDNFTYEANDGTADSSVVTVTITVTAVTGASDGCMFLAKMQCGINWAKHAAGANGDRLSIVGRCNPRGAVRDLSGATVVLRVNDVQVMPAVILDSDGAAYAHTAGATYKFDFDWHHGAYSLTMSGLDLRTAIGVPYPTATVPHAAPEPIVMDLTISGAGLEIPLVVGTFECPLSTTAGKFSRLTFDSTRDHTLSGLYQCLETGAAERKATHMFTVKGVIEGDAGTAVDPTGDITVKLGTATLVIPFAQLTARGAQWSYKGTAPGITSFSLHNGRHTFVLVATNVAGTGIPLIGPAAPATHRLQVQLLVPTADGLADFDSTIELMRRFDGQRNWGR